MTSLEITDKKLKGLMSRIKPVVRFAKVSTLTGSKLELEKYGSSDYLEEDKSGDLYYIKDVHPRNISLTWNPNPVRMASEVNPNPYKIIVTLHDYIHSSLFQPSIANVLSQIPEEDENRCVAFEIGNPSFSSDNKFHIAETKLYERYRQAKRKVERKK